MLKRTGLQRGVLSSTAPIGLPLDEVTLAQRLQAAAYFTAMVGKWHLGGARLANLPHHRGFDRFFGFAYAGGQDYWTHR